ncbi:hypothetical protein ACQHIV_11695 [Kribbella sp. GL6]|uniref:hypothetical protein n=1 Tax=Kribbella sp. GL6 TaxID=3419765 RepID=UPI003D074D76
MSNLKLAGRSVEGVRLDLRGGLAGRPSAGLCRRGVAGELKPLWVGGACEPVGGKVS